MKKRILLIVLALIATFSNVAQCYATNNRRYAVTNITGASASGVSGFPTTITANTQYGLTVTANDGFYTLNGGTLNLNGSMSADNINQEFIVNLNEVIFVEHPAGYSSPLIYPSSICMSSSVINLACIDDDITVTFIDEPRVNVSSTNPTYLYAYIITHKVRMHITDTNDNTANSLTINDPLLRGSNFLNTNVFYKFNATVFGNTEDVDKEINRNVANIRNEVANITSNIQVLHTDLQSLQTGVTTINNRLNTVNNHLNNIEQDVDDIANDVSVIMNNSNTSAQKDAQDMQGFQNMQNTDGLVDVGDNTNFMSSFNAVNNFLGGIKNATPTNCIINGNLGNLDLGQLDACQLPSEIRTVIQTVAGFVFAVFDFLILWNSIKYILGVINWARAN